mmetsp:Transcript_29862/g.63413  ORF Transcript_29862/g.63413 Transcript_29862/m.63413 type:complete len:150 (+) Transcript_29862:648-1097(+)
MLRDHEATPDNNKTRPLQRRPPRTATIEDQPHRPPPVTQDARGRGRTTRPTKDAPKERPGGAQQDRPRGCTEDAGPANGRTQRVLHQQLRQRVLPTAAAQERGAKQQEMGFPGLPLPIVGCKFFHQTNSSTAASSKGGNGATDSLTMLR